MKKLSVILMCVIFFGMVVINAQMQQMNKQQQGMQTGSGMMQGGRTGIGMMSSMGQKMMAQHMIMKQHTMMVNNLPYMQKQLSLSQEQQDELIDIWSTFRKGQIEYQSELTKANRNLQDLLDNNGAVDKVRDQMESYYDIKVKMKAEVYETVQKMKSILNEDQKENLRNILMQEGRHMQGNMPPKGQQKESKSTGHNW